MQIRFCSQCGSDQVRYIIPEGDNRQRYICMECHFIHYMNPRIVAGCVVTHGNRILLCKRAIEPRKGLWTLPAGFMENHETTWQAAIRETREEACASVTLDNLFTVLNLPHINQVYMMYRGILANHDYGPGPESLDIKLFDVDKIPWSELAFPAIRETLRLFIKDMKSGHYRLHCGDIIRPWVITDGHNAILKNLVST